MSDGPLERLREMVQYPELHPAYVPVQVDSNTIHIRAGPWSGPIVTLRDDDEENEVASLIERIDGETPVEDIVAEFSEPQRPEVIAVIEALYEKRIIREAEPGPDDGLGPRLPLSVRFQRRERQRIGEKDVLLIDTGGMGGMVAEDLLSADVGSVSYFDWTDDGQTVERLRSDEAFSLCTERDELRSRIEMADFVVYTGSNPKPDLVEEINHLTHRTKTPWISAQIYGYDGIVGPAVFPERSACYECFIERALGNVTSHEHFQSYLDVLSEQEGLTSVSRSPLGRIVAGYLTLDVIHLLTYGVGFTVEQVITVDGLDLSYEANDVLRMPDCDVCGREQGPDHTRFLGLEDFERDKDLLNTSGE